MTVGPETGRALDQLCAGFQGMKAFGHRKDLELRQDRGRIAALLASVDDADLPGLDRPVVRAAIRTICGLQICHHNLTASEHRIVDQLRTLAGSADAPNRFAALLAATLFRAPWQILDRPRLADVPDPLLPWLTELFVQPPQVMSASGDADRIIDFSMALARDLEALLAARPDAPAVRAAREAWLDWADYLPCHISDHNMLPLMQARGRLMMGYLRDGAPQLLDWTPPPRDPAAPIRVGLLIDRIADNSETIFSLAHVERLPRPEFEVTVASLTTVNRDNPFARQVIAAADRFEPLPAVIGAAARQLRALDLDVLLFGVNLSFMPHRFSTLLGAVRSARIQVATMCSPATTGLATIDSYLSADHVQPPSAAGAPAADSYSEALWLLPGGIKQFALPDSRPRSAPVFRRAAAGIPEAAVLLISGANCFKIVPELSRTWLEILAAAPQAHLALYPFNPNWAAVYQHEPFIQRLKDEAAALGVDPQRISILKPLPHAADIEGYLRAADLYLDSHPYSGAVSLLDPLRLGLPVVAWQGHEARTRQAASILRDIGLPDLVADSRDAYKRLAIDLVRDPDRRRRLAQRVQARVADGDPLTTGRTLEDRLAVRLREAVAALPTR